MMMRRQQAQDDVVSWMNGEWLPVLSILVWEDEVWRWVVSSMTVYQVSNERQAISKQADSPSAESLAEPFRCRLGIDGFSVYS